MKAIDKFISKTNKQLHIAVGLDSDINKIPAHLKELDNPVFAFRFLSLRNNAGNLLRGIGKKFIKIEFKIQPVIEKCPDDG